MKKDQIKQIALDCGFKLKEQSNGLMDLNPYVYDFALAIIKNQKGTVMEQTQKINTIEYSTSNDEYFINVNGSKLPLTPKQCIDLAASLLLFAAEKVS